METKYKTYIIAKIVLVTSLCSILAGSEAEELGVKIERNVPVPMRDGTILRADVHRPDRGGPSECERFAKAGYIAVCQDVRGRYESEGKWESLWRFNTHDAEDGYDTVEWAAKLPGSNSKVGTFGMSYGAFLQWRLAPLRPPSLIAMSACSMSARYTGDWPGMIRPVFVAHRPGVAWDMRRRTGRPGVHTAWETTKLSNEGEFDKWVNWLPWLELPQELHEDEHEAFMYLLKNPHLDPWKLDDSCKDIVVPNLDIVGWCDHANGDMVLFRTMVEEAKTEVAREGSRIIIGPWNHTSRLSRRYGDIDFGPSADFDRTATQIRWFDYWLKGIQNKVDEDTPVRIFVMGDNKWRVEQHWPLERTTEKILFIISDGHANTPSGDGKLVRKKPASSDKDGYTYDPKDPVPTPYKRRPIPADQRPLANRQDILVYQTEPLTERVEVTGNPVVELHAASSAPDTDWVVRLIDVYQDGLALDVSQGIIRARYRNGLDKPVLIKPGETVKYTIRMRPTSNAFLPGHRIRLDITSSDFPNYDRNHNTAANQNADATLVTAKQTIYHGGQHATRILLPWVPNPTAKERSTEEEKPEPETKEKTHQLHQAAADGDSEQVKLLIIKGAKVSAKNENGNTALHFAVANRHKAMVKLLIAKGADVDVRGQHDAAPLHAAAWEGHKDIAELLIAQGANINAWQGEVWTPLHSAASQGHAHVVEFLIEKGADINAGPYTALHEAAQTDRLDIVELLIQKGADVNAKDSSGMTPFDYALSTNEKDVAELLLAKTPDFSSKNNRGLTTLHDAAVGGYADIAELLLAKGAKVDERDDNYEFTALHYAVRFGNKNVAEVLITNGADIKAKDKWDYQPIHWAAYHDRADVVELLISKGADINVKTSLGQTPLQLAEERRNTKTVDLLRKHGAKE
jgi:putative CocE/NonD family hydrolase